MKQLVFVQMSGALGSGKSTLARAIAKQINAVIIDHIYIHPRNIGRKCLGSMGLGRCARDRKVIDLPKYTIHG